MASPWLEKLKKAQKTCIIQDGRRKIHYSFSDGTELSEEYSVKNGELIVRKWRKKGTLGGVGNWDYEIGEELVPRRLDSEGMVESTANPIFVRKDTLTNFQWRIRNLPYTIDNYIVTVSDDNQQIIIKTKNKKYYKKFNIPDMERNGLVLKPENVQIAHANNTLIVTYPKPEEILKTEKQLQQELQKMKASQDGDVDCRPS
ncbi:hypothetical protein LOTGIDRAFT_119809 [Lottia gigantea]|uniref:Protein DPCD n=1 Tax=Lottia gigantea TaxID=225164 RepID=V4BVP6_LOTGI|nr:hypothetical protein LOTGIDRAFT_119809 [Lottia gigantea]ESO93099.1 hypothetical protein LOTGIDRAFT_119809 [Lottia gigantea]